MVRILGFHCCGLGSIPGQEIPKVMQCSQTNKQEKQDVLLSNSGLTLKDT